MSLLQGEAADRALKELLGKATIPVIAIDPQARAGKTLRVLAIASGQEVITLMPAQCPTLSHHLGNLAIMGAFKAKEVARALLREMQGTPQRWACIYLTEQILGAGRDWKLGIDDITSRYGLGSIPPTDGGLEALQSHALQLSELISLQIPQIKQQQLGQVSKLEAAAVTPIAHMEHHGIFFDAQAWRKLADDAAQEQQQLKRELSPMFASVSGETLFGETDLNLDSDAELKKALIALGHNVPNVRRSTVAKLPAPLGPGLSRYRELSKLLSTYGMSFLEHVHDDQRIRPTFEQIGASTGRMACHAPNLQSVVGGHRSCFCAPEGSVLITADYSACELRIIAEMSGDPVFIEAFDQGQDLHARVASTIFGKPVSKTENPDLRQRAKAINFGLAYGMGAAGLARSVGCAQPQAEQMLRDYFRSFPKIREFLEKSAKTALNRGFAQTLSGRRLYLEPDDTRESVAQAERIAKNMPIQGGNADMTKIALARLHQRFASQPEIQLVNVVHDEVVVECPADHAESTQQAVIDEMVGAGQELLQRVPIAVDASVASFWGK